MYANKNKNQYTTLIHEGENVTIDPPGVINAEGGGGGGTVDPVTPFNIKHDGNTVASFSDDGSLTLEGGLTINGDEDIEDVIADMIDDSMQIFDVDIVGDYTNGTFTSQTSFSDVLTALQDGLTIIVKDSNGFVYTQSNSVIDPENTDTVMFVSVQSDGIYQLSWTANTRTITEVSLGGEGDIVIVDADSVITSSTTQKQFYDYMESIYETGKTYVLKVTVSDYPCFLEMHKTLSAWTAYGVSATTEGVYTYSVYAGANTTSLLNIPSTNSPYINITNMTVLQLYYRGGNVLYTHPTSSSLTSGYYLESICPLTDGGRRHYFKQIPTIIWMDGTEHYVLTLVENSGDYTGTSYPKTYTYRYMDLSSTGLLSVKELVVSILSNTTGTNSYTVTPREYSVQIGVV